MICSASGVIPSAASETHSTVNSRNPFASLTTSHALLTLLNISSPLPVVTAARSTHTTTRNFRIARAVALRSRRRSSGSTAKAYGSRSV